MKASIDDNDVPKSNDAPGIPVEPIEKPITFEEVQASVPKKIKEEVKQSELKKQQEKFMNLEIKATVVPKEEILDVTSFNLPAKINEKAEQIKEIE